MYSLSDQEQKDFISNLLEQEKNYNFLLSKPQGFNKWRYQHQKQLNAFCFFGALFGAGLGAILVALHKNVLGIILIILGIILFYLALAKKFKNPYDKALEFAKSFEFTDHDLNNDLIFCYLNNQYNKVRDLLNRDPELMVNKETLKHANKISDDLDDSSKNLQEKLNAQESKIDIEIRRTLIMPFLNSKLDEMFKDEKQMSVIPKSVRQRYAKNFVKYATEDY